VKTAAALLATIGLGGLAGFPFPLPLPHLPQKVERWLWNPRERTERSIEAYKKGDARRAQRTADTALRLAPDDPRVAFADGTAHLAAGDERGAARLLQRAAEAAPPDLAPAAWYNLGNARLAGRDAGVAVEAYRRALLAAPGDADAKFNLELALREQQRQRSGPGARQQGQRGNRGGGGQASGNPGGEQQSARQPGRGDSPERGSQRPGEGQRGQEGQAQAPQQAGRNGARRFQEQPDMSASEAAALLQSVENLERQQRRAEAARRARRRAPGEKDW
jgi:tetratricopeptide (TPR) repeat protein